jgi:hypothetical protein
MSSPRGGELSSPGRKYRVFGIPHLRCESAEIPIYEDLTSSLPHKDRVEFHECGFSRSRSPTVTKPELDKLLKDFTVSGKNASKRCLRKMHREALRQIIEAEKIIRRSVSSRRIQTMPPTKRPMQPCWSDEVFAEFTHGLPRARSMGSRPQRQKHVIVQSYFDRTMRRAQMLELRPSNANAMKSTTSQRRRYPSAPTRMANSRTRLHNQTATAWPAETASKRDIRLKAPTYSGNRKPFLPLD